jgi:hypothetical protein
MKCLCVVGCSVNGECPIHGDDAIPVKTSAYYSGPAAKPYVAPPMPPVHCVSQIRVTEIVPLDGCTDRVLMMSTWRGMNTGLMVPVEAGIKVGDIVAEYGTGPGRPITAVQVIAPNEGPLVQMGDR